MASEEKEEVPWWNRNVPLPQRTTDCLEYLLHATERQKQLMGQLDADHMPMSWREVRDCVGIYLVLKVKQVLGTLTRSALNRIDLFRRLPSDLRRYKAFLYEKSQEYGSKQISYFLSIYTGLS